MPPGPGAPLPLSPGLLLSGLADDVAVAGLHQGLELVEFLVGQVPGENTIISCSEMVRNSKLTIVSTFRNGKKWLKVPSFPRKETVRNGKFTW